MTTSASAGRIDHAAWLADGLLVLTGWLHANGSEAPRLRVAGSAPAPGAEVAGMFLQPTPDEESRSHTPMVVVIPVPGGDVDGLALVHITGAGEQELAPASLATAVTDLRTLIREAFAPRDAGARAVVLDFLTSFMSDARGGVPALRLTVSLRLLRDGLRERLALSGAERGGPVAVGVDSLLRVDERCYVAIGWVRQAQAAASRLTIDCPEGMRVDLLDRAWFHDRPDLDRRSTSDAWPDVSATRGFVCHFQLPGATRRGEGWVLEMADDSGRAVEAAAPPVVTDPLLVRRALVATLGAERLPADRLRRDHIHPAVSRIQDQLARAVDVLRVDQHGTPTTDPPVSVLVTLYARLDLLEHQMAQFALDPQLREADLVYVLDSPELADQLLVHAKQLHRLYGLPFRTVTLTRHAGVAEANNAGARLATAPLLLLLNSDVLPDRPGWLGEMVSFHRRTPSIGALGAKLLFEDETLQHAGVYFDRPSGEHLWVNRHYFKGFDRHLPRADVARPVPAVTGACMLVDRAVFHDVGAESGAYIQCDFEDTDLCLRLSAAGLTNWYQPAAELYHLEAQSFGSGARREFFDYNCWLHSDTWSGDIERVMARFAPGDDW